VCSRVLASERLSSVSIGSFRRLVCRLILCTRPLLLLSRRRQRTFSVLEPSWSVGVLVEPVPLFCKRFYFRALCARRQFCRRGYRVLQQGYICTFRAGGQSTAAPSDSFGSAMHGRSEHPNLVANTGCVPSIMPDIAIVFSVVVAVGVADCCSPCRGSLPQGGMTARARCTAVHRHSV
jgi:hypothetical protein